MASSSLLHYRRQNRSSKLYRPHPDERQKRQVAKILSSDVFDTFIIIEMAAPEEGILVQTANSIITHYRDDQALKAGIATYIYTKEAQRDNPTQLIKSQAQLDK